VRQADGEGAQDEYSRTKEIGLVRGIEEWVRLYADQENRCYKVFPAPADRFGDPHWPELKEAKNLSISLPRSRAPNRFNAASIVPEVGRS